MKKIEIAILLIVVIVCIFRFFTKTRDDLFLAQFKDKKVIVEGLILEEPDNRVNGTRVLLSVQNVSISSSTELNRAINKSLVLATVRTSLDLRYGDVVDIEGTLQCPEIIVGSDGRSFDYPRYLGKEGIYYLLKGVSVQRISRHQGNRIKEVLLEIKSAFIEKVNQSLPEPYSLLANGLVVAGKGALSDDLQEQFKRVGLIHVVVLSGSNVTIVADAITKILSFLPKFIGAAGGVFGIVAFTIIAGTSATVVRSAIMSIIAVTGKTFGRQGTAMRSLIIAACLMALLNPDIVIYDPSFQLSFTGTFGLIIFGETTERWFKWIPERGGLREIISASVASQLSITPMILHMSGVFSLVALIVNVMILPFIPLTMLAVFLTGCMRFISQILSTPFSIVSYGLLSYELILVALFSNWKYAAITVPAIPWLGVFGIYTTYLLVFLCYRTYKKPRLVKDETLVKPSELPREKSGEGLGEV